MALTWEDVFTQKKVACTKNEEIEVFSVTLQLKVLQSGFFFLSNKCENENGHCTQFSGMKPVFGFSALGGVIIVTHGRAVALAVLLWKFGDNPQIDLPLQRTGDLSEVLDYDVRVYHIYFPMMSHFSLRSMR